MKNKEMIPENINAYEVGKEGESEKRNRIAVWELQQLKRKERMGTISSEFARYPKYLGCISAYKKLKIVF